MPSISRYDFKQDVIQIYFDYGLKYGKAKDLEKVCMIMRKMSIGGAGVACSTRYIFNIDRGCAA